MNLIVMGDYNGAIEKACAKSDYTFVLMSKLLRYDFAHVEYTKNTSLRKEEKLVGSNSSMADKLSDIVDVRELNTEARLFNACSILCVNDNIVLFVDIPEESLLFYLKNNLDDNCKFIFNTCVNEFDSVASPYSEFLYDHPTLPCIFTKKSRVKNIISELENVPEGLHMYCYRPRQLGLDISMSSTGVAAKVVDCRGREKTVFGRLKTKRTKIDICRMKQINEKIHNVEVRDRDGKIYLIDLKYASEMCIEGGAFGAVQGAFRLGQFAGMLLAALYRTDIKFFYVAPTSLKKIITGYGRAAKGLMEIMIKERLNIDVPINDDEADALCLLTCLTDPDIELKDENLD